MRSRPAFFALTLSLNLMMGLTAWAQSVPDISVLLPSGVELTANQDAVDMGTVFVGTDAPEVVLTVKNVGSAMLSSLAASITGPDASLFSRSVGINVVSAGSSTTIKLGFKTKVQTRIGPFQATLNITSNDPDESPFVIGLSALTQGPEILVKRPDETEVGSGNSHLVQAPLGAWTSISFSVFNKGSTDLTGLTLSWAAGSDSSAYTIRGEMVPEVLHPEHGGSFIVMFQPVRGGAHPATLILSSNDPDEGTFLFHLNGIGMEPEIKVEQPAGFDRTDGGTLNLGPVNLGTSKSLPFTLKNTGTNTLRDLAVTKDGAHADEFVIAQDLPVTELAAGASTTFTVLATPGALGTRTAALHISSNDADENPFDLNLTALGSTPEIRLEYRGNEIPQQSTYHFGSFDVKMLAYQWLERLRDFTVKNTGTGPLRVDRVEVTGPQASAFRQSPVLSSESAPPGEGLLLRLLFEPTTYGLHTATVKVFSDDEDEPTYEFNVTGMGLLPGFQIEQPADTPVASPYTRQFGLAAVNSTNTTLTFTIKNPGNQALTLSRTITGTNAADFTMVEPYPTYSTPAGSSTTLTVQFSPKGSGARQATLNLTHNAAESGQGTFYVQLRGTGVYSEVALSSSTHNVNHGEAQVSVTVKRDETRVPSSIELQTLSGPRSSVPPVEAALAGEDFTLLTGPSAVVSFAIGEEEKTVTIPLLAPAAGAAESRQFRVRLVNPGPGVVIRPPAEALVRIVGADSAKPTLTLTTPAAGKVTAVWPLVVSGKAGDAKGIDRVEVKLGDSEPVLATLSQSANKPTDVPFTCDLHPADGTHALVVTAYDLRGNSTSVTRTIAFTRRHTLTVKLVDGSADPVGLPGTLAMTATPAAAAAPLKTDPTDALIKTTTVVPGTQVKLVATPKAGYVFGRWLVLNSNGNVVHTGPELTFTMPDTGLTVEAMLVPSPFAPLPGHNNSLHWMLVPAESTEAPLTAPQFGYLSGTITLKGGFTGKLLMNGQTLPVTATFYGDGPAFFTVAGQKRDSLPVPGGNLKLYYDYLPATLTSPTGELLAMADLQHGLAKAPASLLNSATKGTYTVRLNPAPEPLDPATSPQASGYATMTLSNTGVISLAGALADGTAVTQTSALLPGNKAPVFIQLPTPGGTTKLGLLIGQLDFDIVPATTDVTSALQWFRPAAASAKVLLYPAGWPAGISLDAEGALYSATKTAQSALFGLTSITPSPSRLHFTGGKLTSAIEKTNFSLKGNTVVKTAPVDNSYTLTIAPATGIFSGTFTGSFTPNGSNPISAKPAFKGVILQKGAGSAAGFFINNAKGETTPESGAVILGAPVP